MILTLSVYKFVIKVYSQIGDTFFRFFHNFVNFHPIHIIFRYIKELAEHYILGKTFFWKNEKEKEEKEDENFQLLYYLSFMAKRGIGEFPNLWLLQICKWFPTKIIIFEEQTSFLPLIDMKNSVFRRLFKSIRCTKRYPSSKILILVVNHLHICNVQWLRNQPIPLLSIILK